MTVVPPPDTRTLPLWLPGALVLATRSTRALPPDGIVAVPPAGPACSQAEPSVTCTAKSTGAQNDWLKTRKNETPDAGMVTSLVFV